MTSSRAKKVSYNSDIVNVASSRLLYRLVLLLYIIIIVLVIIIIVLHIIIIVLYIIIIVLYIILVLCGPPSTTKPNITRSIKVKTPTIKKKIIHGTLLLYSYHSEKNRRAARRIYNLFASIGYRQGIFDLAPGQRQPTRSLWRGNDWEGAEEQL